MKKQLAYGSSIHKILYDTGWIYVKLCLSKECSWANKRGFFQAVTSRCLSASVLPVTSKPCAHKGFHLVLFHESLRIRAADAQNTAARTANGLASPAINMYGLKFDRIVFKVSPSAEARKEVWQEFSKRYEGTHEVFASLPLRCPSNLPTDRRGLFPLRCSYWHPSLGRPAFHLQSNSGAEVFQTSNSLRYYSCMISRARDVYKLDMPRKI